MCLCLSGCYQAWGNKCIQCAKCPRPSHGPFFLYTHWPNQMPTDVSHHCRLIHIWQWSECLFDLLSFAEIVYLTLCFLTSCRYPTCLSFSAVSTHESLVKTVNGQGHGIWQQGEVHHCSSTEHLPRALAHSEQLPSSSLLHIWCENWLQNSIL